jgi:hypothetical protein
MFTDSTNLQAPDFSPKHPEYPELPQVVRVTAPSLGGNVYPCLVQQFDPSQPSPRLRDREQGYVLEPNGIALSPGYVDCRLVGNYLGLPLYTTTCCPSAGPSSSASPSSPTPGGTMLWALIQETRAQGINAGPANSGSWQARSITISETDPSNILTLKPNSGFQLAAGTYRVRGWSCAIGTDRYTTRLRSDFQGVVVNGESGYGTGGANPAGCEPAIIGRFTSNGTEIFYFEYFCAVSQSSFGLGVAGNVASTPEVYASLEFEKE